LSRISGRWYFARRAGVIAPVVSASNEVPAAAFSRW